MSNKKLKPNQFLLGSHLITERPILFQTEMVKAILDGRKTETRRTKGLEDLIKIPGDFIGNVHRVNGEDFKCLFVASPDKVKLIRPHYGQPGDLLWVRETFIKIQNSYIYKTDKNSGGLVWKPSIHMPKDATRIWLMVEDVRAERLHYITEQSIISEGVLIPVTNKGAENNKVVFELTGKNKSISFLPKGFGVKGAPPLTQNQLLQAFWAELWCNVNGRESYDSNPWVWVVKFKVLSTTGRPNENSLRESLRALRETGKEEKPDG